MSPASRIGSVVVGIAAVGLTMTALMAQEKKKGPARERLQQYWGQLELTEKQREAYDRVGRKYRDQIEELEDKLDALKKKRSDEWMSILTAAQKEKLDSLRRQRGQGPSDAADEPAEKKTKKSKKSTAKDSDADEPVKTTKKKTTKAKPKDSEKD